MKKVIASSKAARKRVYGMEGVAVFVFTIEPNPWSA